ncbi:hypothetical protein NN561_019604 [Cricetulus griseus]
MPVLSHLPAPSPRGGGRGRAAMPGARSRRRSVGARGSSRAGRPRPQGGGPGSERASAAPRCSAPVTDAQVKHSDRSPIRPGRSSPGVALSARNARAGSAGHTTREAPRHALLPADRPFPAAVPPPSPAATARYAAPAFAPNYRETFFRDPECP